MSEIIFASAFDDKYPPSNILLNGSQNFWATTGLFPQEVNIQLENEKLINSANVSSYGIKKLSFESCENESSVNFSKQAEMVDIPFKEGKIQEFFLNFTAQKPVKIIKVTILESYEEFSCIFNITFK
jgi:hypothetical protein